jgi:hypothetical protein
MAKSNLKSAKENKADEFYTQLVDIEKELLNIIGPAKVELWGKYYIAEITKYL